MKPVKFQNKEYALAWTSENGFDAFPKKLVFREVGVIAANPNDYELAVEAHSAIIEAQPSPDPTTWVVKMKE